MGTTSVHFWTGRPTFDNPALCARPPSREQGREMSPLKPSCPSPNRMKTGTWQSYRQKWGNGIGTRELGGWSVTSAAILGIVYLHATVLNPNLKSMARTASGQCVCNVAQVSSVHNAALLFRSQLALVTVKPSPLAYNTKDVEEKQQDCSEIVQERRGRYIEMSFGMI